MVLQALGSPLTSVLDNPQHESFHLLYAQRLANLVLPERILNNIKDYLPMFTDF
jgi:hypothetical protein